MITHKHKILLLALTLLTFSGCSWLNPFADDEPRAATDGDQQSAAATQATTKIDEQELSVAVPRPDGVAGDVDYVEMLWRVPSEPILAYHIFYGTDQKNLTKNVRVLTSALEKVQHPVYGDVYRYQLREVPLDRDVYVSIRAENDNGLSPLSQTMKVTPAQ